MALPEFALCFRRKAKFVLHFRRIEDKRRMIKGRIVSGYLADESGLNRRDFICIETGDTRGMPRPF